MTEILTAAAGAFRGSLSMALTALPVMAAVLAVRWVLARCRAPKRIAYALWAAVGFRLVCPVTLSSVWSIFNAVRPVAEATAQIAPAGIPAGRLSTVDFNAALPSLEEIAPLTGVGAENILSVARPAPAEIALRIGAVLWIVGVAAIAVYSVVSYVRLRRSLATAVALERGVYQADGIATPFVLGYLRPRIYIPFHMETEELTHVLLHERTHLRRGDPWWKLLGFGILAAYWWNPAAWLCYRLFCRDMEMSCDEAVLRALGSDVKRAYSLSLVSFAAGRRFPAANPLAFGENDAGSRVKNVLGWRRAAPGIAFLAVALSAVLVIACCTNASVGGGSWVRYDDQTQTWSYRFDGTIKSTALYEEIYEYGELKARNVVSIGEVGVGGVARSGSFHMEFEPEYDENGHWTGFNWSYTENDSQYTTVSPAGLPDMDYTGFASSYLSDGTDNGGKAELADGAGVALKAQTMAITQDAAVSAYALHGDAQTQQSIMDDTMVTVLLYMVASSSPMETLQRSLSIDAEAQTLYDLKTPYVGDMPADGAILKALRTEETLGDYTVELFTAQEPYVLQVNLKEQPDEARRTQMLRSSYVLLALIDNLSQVEWTYPMAGTDDGGVLRLDTAAADETLASGGLPEIKTCGASASNFSAMLGWLDEFLKDAQTSYADEPFENVLGYSGTVRRETNTGMGGWGIRHYLVPVNEGRTVCIAESWGTDGELPPDTAVDLDGDGVTELVCNVVYGADGGRETRIYRRGADGVEYADAGELLDVPHESHGIGALLPVYLPESREVEIAYIPEGGEDYATRRYPLNAESLGRLVFTPYKADCDLEATAVEQWELFLNDPENNGFVLSAYDVPENVDLSEVFYCGAGLSGTDDLTDAERSAYERSTGVEISTDMTRITTPQANAFLLEKCGTVLAKHQRGLQNWTYLTQYDAYYNQHGDTNQDFVHVVGVAAGDGEVDVNYTRGGTGDEQWDVHLRWNGDNWQFMFNRPVK
jgi:beta-lactamase regulating signal transducer with metallopeptidase domain